jgi:hypothetical protein
MRSILIAILVLAAGGTANGAEADCLWWLRPWSVNRLTCPRCPDDYCAKPLPCAPCATRCRNPDDYCSKRLPIVCPTKCFGCDDYRPKCLPTVPCGCYPIGASCGPGPCR